ncbi:hypothetical protein BOH72_21915 [Mycobacterium sp. WY10]|nr:hypothetical protein BOH72_21915 [Mycobacterium sp. WY10]
MRCVLISPPGADLVALHATLALRGISALTSAELGAGAALAVADLRSLDFAVAVLPPNRDESAKGMSAIFVEIGVLIGRRLPTLVIVAPPGPPPPALTTLNYVYTDLDNRDALSFHIDLFLKSIPEPNTAVPQVRSNTPEIDLEYFRTYFKNLKSHPVPDQAMRFELGVADLLRACGAIVEERSDPFDPVDIAAYLPGFEKSLGTFVVQAKAGPLSAEEYWAIGGKLGEYVITSRSGLGVLVAQDVTQAARDVGSMPLIVLLDINELLIRLQDSTLDRVLLDARNNAVHGM